jgi:hypothetical protein
MNDLEPQDVSRILSKFTLFRGHALHWGLWGRRRKWSTLYCQNVESWNVISRFSFLFCLRSISFLWHLVLRSKINADCTSWRQGWGRKPCSVMNTSWAQEKRMQWGRGHPARERGRGMPEGLCSSVLPSLTYQPPGEPLAHAKKGEKKGQERYWNILLAAH